MKNFLQITKRWQEMDAPFHRGVDNLGAGFKMA